MYKENRFDKLSLEQTLLILTSRLNISEQEKIWIKDIIIKKDINWFEFYKLAGARCTDLGLECIVLEKY